jgi:hypothetical protein
VAANGRRRGTGRTTPPKDRSGPDVRSPMEGPFRTVVIVGVVVVLLAIALVLLAWLDILF